MNTKLKLKCEGYIADFKTALLSRATELGVDQKIIDQLESYSADYPALAVMPSDLQKVKRCRPNIPKSERCSALRANLEQCTRRRKKEGRYCGTHNKGTPHGTTHTASDVKQQFEIQVWAEDMGGIIHFLDKDGNVYDPQDIHLGVINPRVIANYTKLENGTYALSEDDS